ncbi:protein of unknown function (plasmid) [Magnetospirillum sp. XM-1]|uniref:hypothetical protein n=1 Tax=Magnetospirillum sp. XM-1 TaxID=1663591 RepID=UPI00073E00FD|nr:hypothetical protein [Magnetospirillum sp. XM-1]CUW41861.1 protein of unknown function [Magnetospirillum sp. XM-1]
MSEGSSRIDAAANATDRILEHVGTAMNRLSQHFEGRVINGAGVISDPSQARIALSDAIASLRKAQEDFAATNWPVPADYD